jgi:hypothetical protein
MMTETKEDFKSKWVKAGLITVSKSGKVVNIQINKRVSKFIPSYFIAFVDDLNDLLNKQNYSISIYGLKKPWMDNKYASEHTE